jgi:hypothetical protein
VVKHKRDVYLKQNLAECAPVSNKALYLGKHRNAIKRFKGMPVTHTEEITYAHKYFLGNINAEKDWKS